MKHTPLFIAAVLLFGFSSNNSNAQSFENGDNVLSAGLGLGSSLGGYTYSSQTPGISIQFEHGNWDIGGPGVISLGGYLGYKSYSYGYAYPGYSYNQKWSYTIIGLRSAYHYNGIDNKNLDVYGGVMLSYNILSYKYSSSDPKFDYLYHGNYGSEVGLSIYLGGRYYFTDNVAGFLEVGYGISIFTIGAAFKL
jgi:hypothetical protein